MERLTPIAFPSAKDIRMSERPSENAPQDEAGEQMVRIAERARRASSATIKLAALCAYEVLAFHVGDEPGATKRIQIFLDRAIDASARWHSEQLASVVADLARERDRAEVAEAQLARRTAAMRVAILRYARGDITQARLTEIVERG